MRNVDLPGKARGIKLGHGKTRFLEKFWTGGNLRSTLPFSRIRKNHAASWESAF